MLWSSPIVTIAGTVVRIHVTFLLFLVWIGAAQWRVGGREAALEGVVFLVLSSPACWPMFEHIFAARRYGIRNARGYAVAHRRRASSTKPSEELVVALAGPAVHVVIAAAARITCRHFHSPRACLDPYFGPLPQPVGGLDP